MAGENDETTKIDKTSGASGEDPNATRVIPVTPSSRPAAGGSSTGSGPAPDLRSRIDPLRWIGWPLGGALVVWSLVAIARTGFDDFSQIYEATSVAGIATSRLLALVVLAVGLLIWSGVAGADANDIEIRVIGAVAIVFGLVFLIEPDPFRPYLGIDNDFGLVTVIGGILLVVSSLVQPFPVGRSPE